MSRTLKPRKTKSQARRTPSWASIKSSHPSRGWGSKKNVLELFGNKRFVLGLVLIISLVGGVILAQGPLFHSYESSPGYHGEDPFTTVWSDGFASSDLSGFNCNRASYVSSPAKGIQLASDANGPAICVSKSTMDLSTASGKEIEFDMLIESLTTNKEFGWFLTRNGTIPAIGAPDAGYNPATDPNVALYMRMTNQGSQNVLHNLLIQRTPTVAINNDQYPNCQGGSETGICYIVTTILWFAGPPIFNTQRLILNYTGSTAAGGNTGKSFLDNVQASALPWFAFQGQPYYIGFFTATGSSTQQFLAGPNSQPVNTISVITGLPIIPSAPVVAPNIDTGGFFGPIIKALISIGVYILQSIMQFLAYIALVIRVGWNAVGGFFGWGPLGDDVINTFNGLINAIVNIASAIANFLSNLVTQGNNILSIINAWTGTFWTGMTEFFTETAAIFSGLTTIIAKIFQYGGGFYFLYLGILYFQFVGDAGMDGLAKWISWVKWAVFATFGLIIRTLNILIQAIEWVLSHIPMISPKMPETGFPGIPQIEAGPFPGFTIPLFRFKALREGEPFTIFLFIIGAAGFIFYLGSPISPLSAMATFGCNPRACMNNALTTVLYPFLGLTLVLLAGMVVTEFVTMGVEDTGQKTTIILRPPSRQKIERKLGLTGQKKPAITMQQRAENAMLKAETAKLKAEHKRLEGLMRRAKS